MVQRRMHFVFVALVLALLLPALLVLAMQKRNLNLPHASTENKLVEFEDAWQAVSLAVREPNRKPDAIQAVQKFFKRADTRFGIHEFMKVAVYENLCGALSIVRDATQDVYEFRLSLNLIDENESYALAAGMGRVEVLDEMVRCWPHMFRAFRFCRSLMLHQATLHRAGMNVILHLINTTFALIGRPYHPDQKHPFDDELDFKVPSSYNPNDWSGLTLDEIHEGIRGALDAGDMEMMRYFVNTFKPDPYCGNGLLESSHLVAMPEATEFLLKYQQDSGYPNVENSYLTTVMSAESFASRLYSDLRYSSLEDSLVPWKLRTGQRRLLDSRAQKGFSIIFENEDFDDNVEVRFLCVMTSVFPLWTSLRQYSPSDRAAIGLAVNLVLGKMPVKLDDSEDKDASRIFELSRHKFDNSSPLLRLVMKLTKRQLVQLLKSASATDYIPLIEGVRNMPTFLLDLFNALVALPSIRLEREPRGRRCSDMKRVVLAASSILQNPEGYGRDFESAGHESSCDESASEEYEDESDGSGIEAKGDI